MAFRRKPFFTILAIILLVSLSFLLTHMLFPKESQEEITLLLYAVTETETAEAFRVGDLLHDGVTKESLGRISSLKQEGRPLETEAGVYLSESQSRLYITLSVKAERRGECYYIGQTPLLVGQILSLHGRGACLARCLQIRTEANNR